MNQSACMVAVDVGNTAVKLAVRQGQTIRDRAIRIGPSRWENDAIDWVCHQLGCRDAQWRIASVHRGAAERLTEAVAKATPAASLQQITYRDVPMELKVDYPEVLGIDRLMSAYAARQNWGAPLVVVDAGSAVTIDWVDPAGAFCGGAILPGLALQARALAIGTDALPQIRWTADRQVLLPGLNTGDAIYGGILVAMAAGVEAIVRRYRETLADPGQAVPLVVSGGDAAALSSQLRDPHHQIPNLVCRGLLNLGLARV